MLKIPDDLRPATEYDFLYPDNKLIVGITFFVHTYHSDELEEHKTFKGMKLEKWKEWIEDRRVYLKKDLSLITAKSPTTNPLLDDL